MSKLILLFAVCLGLFACGGGVAKKSASADAVQTVQQQQNDRVEVLYFHAKKRCVTCEAIEKNAKEAIESQFADELKRGTVVFKSVDISLPENKALAEKYEVAWSSLFVCKWKDGKETFENFTMYAFSKARIAPESFKKGVAEKIEALLR